MARPGERDLVNLGPWPSGANNLAREDSVPGGQFRRGINVDVYPSGKVRSRPGYELALAAPGADSLWSDGTAALFREGAELRRFLPGTTTQTVVADIDAFADIVYCAVDQYVYVSDQRRAWRVDLYAGTARPWGLAAPAGQPEAVASANGGLHAGAYQVAITYLTADGEESGTTLAVSVDVPQHGGVQLSHIPQPHEPHVTHINVYATRVGSGTLLWHGRLPVGTTDYLVTTQHLGRELQSQHYTQMPAGHAAAFYNGVFYVAADNLLVWSPPHWYGQWGTDSNYLEFEAPIDLVTAAGPRSGGGGLFVAVGRKTYFLPGNAPKEFRQVDMAYGAVRGSGARVSGDAFEIDGLPGYELPVWVDRDGFFSIGLPDGNVQRPTSARYVMGVGEFASAFVRELRGVQQYVVAMPGPASTSRMAFSDTAEMTPVRRRDAGACGC